MIPNCFGYRIEGQADNSNQHWEPPLPYYQTFVICRGENQQIPSTVLLRHFPILLEMFIYVEFGWASFGGFEVNGRKIERILTGLLSRVYELQMLERSTV
eukprot:scaffold8353_cov138-Cylindrotheca_fusiformis.AAC.31